MTGPLDQQEIAEELPTSPPIPGDTMDSEGDSGKTADMIFFDALNNINIEWDFIFE